MVVGQVEWWAGMDRRGWRLWKQAGASVFSREKLMRLSFSLSACLLCLSNSMTLALGHWEKPSPPSEEKSMGGMALTGWRGHLPGSLCLLLLKKNFSKQTNQQGDIACLSVLLSLLLCLFLLSLSLIMCIIFGSLLCYSNGNGIGMASLLGRKLAAFVHGTADRESEPVCVRKEGSLSYKNILKNSRGRRRRTSLFSSLPA